MRHLQRVGATFYIFTLLLTLFARQALAEEPTAKDAQALIDSSVATLARFLDDKALEGFRDGLREAKGVIIVPRLVGAGLIVGGSGGKCTILARYGSSSKWSQPWFCNTASVGVQIGKNVREVVALVMTEAGMDAVKRSEPLSSSADKADLLVFSSDTEGGRAGKPLAGAYLSPADGFNKAYYGKVVTARAVFERKEVYNRDTSKLVSLVTRNAKARRR